MNTIPINEHINAGTYRADRHSPMTLIPIKPPAPPKWLSKLAKTKFKEIAGKLAAGGVLTTLDVDAVACYSAAWATWLAASEAVEKEGQTYKHEGLVKVNPSVAIMQAAARELQVWGEKLGLSPSSRRRMRVEQKTDEKKGVAVRDRGKGPPPPPRAGAV